MPFQNFPPHQNRDRWVIVGVAAVVIGGFAVATAGAARDFWFGVLALILFVCAIVLLELDTITKNVRRERRSTKRSQAEAQYAAAWKMLVSNHRAPEAHLIIQLALPYFPTPNGGKLMHPGANQLRASVEILDTDGVVIASCLKPAHMGDNLWANYPQEFEGGPRRLQMGVYKVRWTNLTLATVIGERQFEIDDAGEVKRSKELEKRLRRAKRRNRLRELTKRDS